MKEYIYKITWGYDDLETFKAAYHREHKNYIEFFDTKGKKIKTALWGQIKKFSRVLI
jgi:hypothetical protein